MPEWTEGRLLTNLYRQYGYKMVNAVVPHAPLGLAGGERGFGQARLAGSTETIRYIDALVLFRDKRWAVEVKVSKADLRSELANPAKVVLWQAHTNAFYYLVSPDLAEVALAEVPKPAGVMVPEGGFTKIVRRAVPNREPLELPYDTWRRISRRYGQAKLAPARPARLE